MDMGTDAELMDELHRDLDQCAARISKIALAGAFLTMLALWCWSQQAAS